MVRLLGVVNVTPDSFSDGGLYPSVDAAVGAGLQMVDDGAWAVDVGGCSTRPGATPTDAQTELERVAPVVRALTRAGARVSIDSMDAGVVDACLSLGATMINDVSGGLYDNRMLDLAARSGATLVVSHWRAPSDQMAARAVYSDVAHEVRDELADRVDAALEAGVKASNLIVDPGIGFAKTASQNWELLTNLSVLRALGYELMIGTSRKSLFREILGTADLPEDEPGTRDDLTAASTALAALLGIDYVRVHNVPANRRAAAVGMRWRGEMPSGGTETRSSVTSELEVGD
ncbi:MULTISPECIES: dihydropteroate synthase [unclassified Nocardioides]|uniref:dihydropteroate synthase n=1 Tax=unclassified Nocardioides TaxID=2615069 RepID=UPI000057090F|nr:MULTISPECIES: dihydropteroate synthase [unclassified Nocardioides]ABL80164.1 Dihydropteroate synthase [Nocardioides sp. JS614]